MNKTITKILEFEGRGLSYTDAIDGFAFDNYGNVLLNTNKSKYRNGVLRIKRKGNRAVPVIMYEGETEDQLCVAFQAKKNDQYVDFDVNAIAEALTYQFFGSIA